MGSEYDKLKKLMSEDNDPVPPELNWERMEAGILQKMDELQSGKSSSSQRRRLIRSGRIVAILFILLLGLFLCNDTENDSSPLVSPDQAATEQPASPERPSEDKASLQPPSSADNPDQPSTDDNNREEGVTSAPALDRSRPSVRSKAKASSQPPNAKGNLHPTPIQDKTAKEKSPGSFAAADASVTDSDHTVQPEQRALSIVESDAQPGSDDLVGNPAAVAKQASNLGTPAALLPAKELMVAIEQEPVQLPAGFRAVSADGAAPKQAAASSDRITLLSGLTWWGTGYGATKPERHPYERTITSYHVQLNYLHTLKRDYTLLVGLQYQQLESRLDWSSSLDNYTIILTDTIVQVQSNLLTKKQLEVRGDVEVNAPAMRTVRHYNQTRIYQIPFALGKTWSFKQWQADVLFGGSLNILSQNKGRTLYLGEIQDYDGASTDFLNPQWNIHVLFMGRLSYRINDHFGITTGIQLQRSLTNWSTESSIKMYPNVLSWELGMSYQFN